MKAQKLLLTKYKVLFIAFCMLAVITLLRPNSAYSQIDYSFGHNDSGVRLGLGAGIATLITHFNSNPIKPVYIGSIDYDINPYLSFGLEAQYGTLQGIDDIHHLYYYSSTDNYFSGTANIRVAIGQFNDFYSTGAVDDALKRIYIGIGAGAIKTNNKFVVNADTRSGIYGSAVPEGKYLLIPLNIGTNIDLPNVLGYDRISINPNFQLNYVNSLYLDGFQSTPTSSLKGFYNIYSIKLKIKL